MKNKIANDTKSSSTDKTIVAWNGETYKGVGAYYKRISAIAEFEHFADEEIIRLAIFAWNESQTLTDEELIDLAVTERLSFVTECESEAKFAEKVVDSSGFGGLPNWVKIDYQATWDTELRFDYFCYDIITIDGIYKKYFWSNNY